MTWATVQCVRAVSSAARSHAWARASGIHGSHGRVLTPTCWCTRRPLTSSAVQPNKSEHARQQFREDGLAEREADSKDVKEAEKRGFDPSNYKSQDGEELNERLTFREEASAERVADAQDVDAAERRGYNPNDYKKPPSEEDVRKDFEQDAAAEREADAKDLAAAKERGYNPADYEKSGESEQDKMRDDFREDALAESEANQENNAAAQRRGFNRYPASFVLPTTVPHIDRLTKSEAHHRQKLLHLLNLMNLPQFLHAFAYGSGVFSQTPTAKRQPNGTPPMIDMVISVQNPVHWHSRNMINNPSHYPWWVRMAPSWVLRRVQNMGAGVWYIPYVKVEDKDLLQWDSLYLSGRMQKPVATLFDSTEGRVPLAEQANLASALRASFLLLPERFNERDLYTKMASLSYMGDFRMRVPGGENKNKIRNIVENQHTWFRFMCADLVTRFRFVTVESNPNMEWLQLKVGSPH
ncbi:hypothetical protein CBS14141_000167 [Malassezia furfur]|nr:hypothetical protein CBS14141_000167 [Malassezia furfur]